MDVAASLAQPVLKEPEQDGVVVELLAPVDSSAAHKIQKHSSGSLSCMEESNETARWGANAADQIEAAARIRAANASAKPNTTVNANPIHSVGKSTSMSSQILVSPQSTAALHSTDRSGAELGLVAAISPLGIIGRSRRESLMATADNPRRSTERRWQRALRRQHIKEQQDRKLLQQSRKIAEIESTHKRSQRQRQKSAVVRTRKLLAVAQRQWNAGRLEMAYKCVSEGKRLLCKSLDIEYADSGARSQSLRPSTVDSSTQTSPTDTEGKTLAENDETKEKMNALELLKQCEAALEELQERVACEAEEYQLHSRSLPNIMNAFDRKDRRIPTPRTAATREQSRKTAKEWRASLEKKIHERADQSLRHANGVFRIPQELDLRRTLVNLQQGLSLQWGADEFAQVTAELVAEEPFETSADNRSAANSPQDVCTNADCDVSDKRTIGSETKYQGSGLKASFSKKTKDLSHLTALWTRPHAGAGEKPPGHEYSIEAMLTAARMTPRRKGWSRDAEVIYADGLHRGRPSTRPHPLLWKDGADNCKSDGLTFRPFDRLLKQPKYSTNSFRAKTPSTVAKTRPRPFRGQPGRRKLPNYESTQNSFKVENGWYEASIRAYGAKPHLLRSTRSSLRSETQFNDGNSSMEYGEISVQCDLV